MLANPCNARSGAGSRESHLFGGVLPMSERREPVVHWASRMLRRVALVVGVGLLSGCAAVSSHPQSLDTVTAGSIPVSAMSPQEQAHYYVLAGEVALGNGREEFAARQYLDALRLQPSASLAKRTVRIATQAGDAGLEKQAVAQ